MRSLRTSHQLVQNALEGDESVLGPGEVVADVYGSHVKAGKAQLVDELFCRESGECVGELGCDGEGALGR